MIETFSYTNEQLTGHTNHALGLMLEYYLKHDLITQEKYNELSHYQFVIAKKGFFSKFFDKIWPKEENKEKFIIVKIGS